ncbi:MAG: CHASE3 domain-containing protein, partial [Symbiobacteriaceae bacterium]
QRGYLLTRDAAFLAPYQNAVRRVDRDVALFKEQTIDNPDQQHRAEMLSRLVHERFNALDFALGNADGQPPDMVQALQTGKARMDAQSFVNGGGVQVGTRFAP